MSVQFSPISLLLFLSALVTALSAVGGWRHRRVPGARPFVALMVLVAYWSLTYGMQLLRPSLAAQLYWDAMQYPGGFLAPVAFFVFALSYTGRDGALTRRRLGALVALPLATAAAVWVPRFRSLVRADATLIQVAGDSIAHVSYGPLFLLTVGYSYVLVALGLGLLVTTTLQAPRLYRQQASLITVGALVPITGSVLTYLLDLTVVDLTPVALSVFGLTFALALSRYRLLDTVPLARTEVVGQIDDGILVTDEHGQIVDINAAARDILGVEDVIGTRLSLLDTAPGDAIQATVVDSTTEFSVGETQPRYFECRKKSLAEHGRIERGHLYILHDITDRRTREQWFRSLTEHSSDVICVLDDDLRVSYVSHSISRILGRDPSAVSDRPFLDLIDPSDRERVEETLRTTGEEPTQVTFRAKTADGTWRTLQSKHKDRLADPVVAGIVLNIRDVTESRARERELREKNDRLDAFAGIVSHDLRNPLTVAKGRTKLLEEELTEPSHTEHLDSLSGALERMETIVEETLLLARRGETITETERVEIGDLVRHCWGMVDTAESSVELIDEFAVHGDRERLEHVFENLFRNAVEHGSTSPDSAARQDAVEHGSTSPDSAARQDAVEHGGSDVTVRVGRFDDGFYVEDDGPGIPEHRRSNVFEFGETSSADGSGFGLAIVKRIADAHGWNVQVADGSDGGARFEFTMVDLRDTIGTETDVQTE